MGSIDDKAALSLTETVHNNGFTVARLLLEPFSGEAWGSEKGGLAGLAGSGVVGRVTHDPFQRHTMYLYVPRMSVPSTHSNT